MKTIIAGSRDGIEPEDFADAIAACGWSRNITEVVSGLAKGVDEMGLLWADANGIRAKGFRADWDKYGKSAGPIRNGQMAAYADALLIVWDGKSRGSANMLGLAIDAQLRVFEWIPERYRKAKETVQA